MQQALATTQTAALLTPAPSDEFIHTLSAAMKEVARKALPITKARAWMILTNVVTAVTIAEMADDAIIEAYPLALTSRFVVVGSTVALLYRLATFIGNLNGEVRRLEQEQQQSGMTDALTQQIQAKRKAIVKMLQHAFFLSACLATVAVPILLLERHLLVASGVSASVAEQVDRYNRSFSLSVLPGYGFIVLMQFFLGVGDVNKAALIRSLQNIMTAASVYPFAVSLRGGMYGIGAAPAVSTTLFTFAFLALYRRKKFSTHPLFRLPRLRAQWQSGMQDLIKGAKGLLANGWPFMLEDVVNWGIPFITAWCFGKKDKAMLRAMYSTIQITPSWLTVTIGYGLGIRALLSNKIGALRQYITLARNTSTEVDVIKSSPEFLQRLRELRLLISAIRWIGLVATGVFCVGIISFATPLNRLMLGGSTDNNSDTVLRLTTTTLFFNVGTIISSDIYQSFPDKRSLRYPALVSCSIATAFFMLALSLFFGGENRLGGLWLFVLPLAAMVLCYGILHRAVDQRMSLIANQPEWLLDPEQHTPVSNSTHGITQYLPNLPNIRFWSSEASSHAEYNVAEHPAFTTHAASAHVSSHCIMHYLSNLRFPRIELWRRAEPINAEFTVELVPTDQSRLQRSVK